VAKIIFSFQFLGSPVWWLYIQALCWYCRYIGPVCTYRDDIMILSIDIKTHTKILNCITKTVLTYLCNLADTDYELPEDDTIVSKHVAAV